MSSTVLVTGGSGLLGREVVKAFEKDRKWKALGTALTRAHAPNLVQLDLTSEDDLVRVLDEIKPQVIVHCKFYFFQHRRLLDCFISGMWSVSNINSLPGAAQRFPDLVEKDPGAARALNITATQTLAELAVERSCFLVYISTDYVFPGTPGDAPYSADAKPAPSNQYGQTKLDGENAVLEVTQETGLGVVFRVPVLYGPVEESKGNKESAVNVLIDAVRKAQDEKVVMDDWSIRYPTNTEDIGRVVKDLASKFLDAGGAEERKKMGRIFQFTSEDRLTKYEICALLADVLGLGLGKMEANKEGNDPNAPVQRPYDCHLSTQELKNLGIDVQTQEFRAWWRWQLGAFRH